MLRQLYIKEIKNNQSGVALILTIMLVNVVLLMLIYFLNLSLTENKIANSHVSGNSAYYLTEAAINEMFWRLQNDPVYESEFISSSTWSTSFIRNNPMGISGSYSVEIRNTSPAHGVITATATMPIGLNKSTQRVVRASVFRAIGEDAIKGNSGYADGNIDIDGSVVTYISGGIHSNNTFHVKNGSLVTVYGNLEAAGNYIESGSISTVTISSSTYAANYPLGPAEEIDMPAVDFNSSSSTSLKNQAVKIYTSTDFEDYIKNKTTVTLDTGVTYVTGSMIIKNVDKLIIPGALVVEGNLTIDNGVSIQVNRLAGKPSGLFSPDKIDFESGVEEINIDGVVYGNNLINLKNIGGSNDFYVKGGLISRQLTIFNCSREIKIEHDTATLFDSLPDVNSSPVVTVDHWEEQY